jgi:hypothetical protein
MVTRSVVLTHDYNIKICCQALQEKCVLQSDGSGQILIVMNGSFSLHNVHLIGGSLPGGGGGNLFVGIVEGGVDIVGCVFENGNAARGGGAAIWSDGTINVVDSEFINNVATHPNYGPNDDTANGGGLSLKSLINAAEAKVSNCIFDGNRAIANDVDVGGGGGGLYAENIAKLIVEKSTFRNNSAAFGGAMHLPLSVGEFEAAGNSIGDVANEASDVCDEVYHENNVDPYYTCKDVNGLV